MAVEVVAGIDGEQARRASARIRSSRRPIRRCTDAVRLGRSAARHVPRRAARGVAARIDGACVAARFRSKNMPLV